MAKTFTGIGMSQPEGIGYAFSMPPIMGMSMSGGFEGYIQNRAGATSQELMAKTQEFIDAANKRPELTNVKTTFRSVRRNIGLIWTVKKLVFLTCRLIPFMR